MARRTYIAGKRYSTGELPQVNDLVIGARQNGAAAVVTNVHPDGAIDILNIKTGTIRPFCLASLYSLVEREAGRPGE